MNTNFYHRYLKLPFQYPKPNKFNHGIEGIVDLVNDEPIYEPFKLWVESFGLTICNIVEGFYTKPNGGQLPLHSDIGYQVPGVNDYCKLNFTWGPQDSTTRWYKIKDESKLVKKYFGIGGGNDSINQTGVIPDIDISYAWFADWEDADLVYEAVINRPSLLNVSQLHSTWNPSPDQHRWTLSFSLMENGEMLTFQRALEIFKEYIEE